MSLLRKYVLGLTVVAACAVPAWGADLQTFVRVDDKHVINLSQVSEVALRQEVLVGDNKPTWVLDVRYIGVKDPAPIYFDQEKAARDAWAHLLEEMGVR